LAEIVKGLCKELQLELVNVMESEGIFYARVKGSQSSIEKLVELLKERGFNITGQKSLCF
jgi:fatty acid-binding protein DegV